MYGISGINYNPYLGGLGMYGLNDFSSYSSYMPSMMPSSIFGMNGLMGMWNPAYMATTQQNIESSYLNHSANMYNQMLNNETEAFKAKNNALLERAMVNGSVNSYIDTLAQKIRERDQKGICEEFEKLKHELIDKNSDYFKKNPNLDVHATVIRLVEDLYANRISQQYGKTTTLKGDIEKYGLTPFEQGFWKSFYGKDFSNTYSDETISYIYGTRNSNMTGKARWQSVGKWTEKVTEGVAATAAGYAGGVAALGVTSGLGKLFFNKGISLKNFGTFGKWGAALALGADILWQMSRD